MVRPQRRSRGHGSARLAIVRRVRRGCQRSAHRRALESPGSQLVRLFGEGTFHQIHGGAATSRRFGWDEAQADYARLRGSPFKPIDLPPVFVGGLPGEALPHLESSVDWLARARGRSGRWPGWSEWPGQSRSGLNLAASCRGSSGLGGVAGKSRPSGASNTGREVSSLRVMFHWPSCIR